MTEEQIENRVCRMFDELDKRYLSSNSMSADEYEKQSKAIDTWADSEYRRRFPGWDRK
jgi:hypothetical protein